MILGKLVSTARVGGREGREDETGQQEVEGWREIDQKTPRSRSETEKEKRGGKKLIVAKNAV